MRTGPQEKPSLRSLPDNLGKLGERGIVPDRLARMAVRRRLKKALKNPKETDAEYRTEAMRTLFEHLSSGPVAQSSARSSVWHSALPATFFEQVLGKHMQASCCLFESGITDFDEAGHAMLALIAERARIRDGQRILDLGCGWGAFSLWAARRFPHATVHAVTGSNMQREWIIARAKQRELSNLTVEACSINHFDPGESNFERIVSIEIFERVRNYRELLARCASWLDEHGRLFVHIAAHRHLAYQLTSEAPNDWMTRYFFTGQIMPSESLLAYFQRDLLLQEHWWLAGQHYRDTANSWLANMDAARDAIMPLMIESHGETEATRRFNRWRLFFMAMAEQFGYRRGNEWGIAQYLFSPRQVQR